MIAQKLKPKERYKYLKKNNLMSVLYTKFKKIQNLKSISEEID